MRRASRVGRLTGWMYSLALAATLYAEGRLRRRGTTWGRCRAVAQVLRNL